jgi:hypothetical protein
LGDLVPEIRLRYVAVWLAVQSTVIGLILIPVLGLSWLWLGLFAGMGIWQALLTYILATRTDPPVTSHRW